MPFRNSKLTRLLRGAIGGNSHTAVICCASPALFHMDETRSTLQFASRASKVQTFAKLNKVESAENELMEAFKKRMASMEREFVHEKQFLKERITDLENRLQNSLKTPRFAKRRPIATPYSAKPRPLRNSNQESSLRPPKAESRTAFAVRRQSRKGSSVSFHELVPSPEKVELGLLREQLAEKNEKLRYAKSHLAAAQGRLVEYLQNHAQRHKQLLDERSSETDLEGMKASIWSEFEACVASPLKLELASLGSKILEYKSAVKDAELMRDKYKHAHEVLTEQMQAKETAIEEHGAAIKALEENHIKALDKMESRYLGAEQSLIAFNQRLEESESSLAQSKWQLECSQLELEDYQSKLVACQDRLLHQRKDAEAQFQSKFNKTRLELNELQAKFSSLQIEHTGAMDSLRQTSQQRDDAQHDLVLAQKELDRSRTLYSDLDATYKEDLGRARDENKSLERRISELENDAERKRVIKLRLDQDHDDLRKQLDDVQKQLSTTLQSTAEQKMTAEVQVSEWSNKFGTIKLELEAQKVELASARDTKQDQDKAIKVLEAKVAELRATKNASQEEFSVLLHTKESLETKVQSLEAEAGRRSQMMSEHVDRIKELTTALKAQEDCRVAKEEEEEEIRCLREELEDKAQTVCSLKACLAKERIDSKGLLADLEKAKGDVKLLEASLAREKQFRTEESCDYARLRASMEESLQVSNCELSRLGREIQEAAQGKLVAETRLEREIAAHEQCKQVLLHVRNGVSQENMVVELPLEKMVVHTEILDDQDAQSQTLALNTALRNTKDLRIQCTALEEAVQQYRSGEQSAQSSIKQMESCINRLKSELASKNSELQVVSSRVQGLEETNTRHCETIRALQGELVEVQTSRDPSKSLRDLLDRARQELAEKNRALEELGITNAELVAQMDRNSAQMEKTSQAQTVESTREVQLLREEVSRLRNGMQKSTNDRAAAEKVLDSIRLEAQQSEERAHTLHKSLLDAVSRAESSDTQVQRFQQDLVSCKNSIFKLQDTCVHFIAFVRRNTMKAHYFQRLSVGCLQSKVHRLKKQHAQLSIDLKASRIHEVELSAACDQARTSLSGFVEMNAKLRQDLELLQAKSSHVAKDSERVTQLERLNKELQYRLNEAQQGLAQKDSADLERMKELEGLNEQLQYRLSETEQQFEQKEFTQSKRIKALEGLNEQLQCRLSETELSLENATTELAEIHDVKELGSPTPPGSVGRSDHTKAWIDEFWQTPARFTPSVPLAKNNIASPDEFVGSTPMSTDSNKRFQALQEAANTQIESLQRGNCEIQEAFREKEQQLNLVLGLFEETEGDFRVLLDLVEKYNINSAGHAERLKNVKQNMQSLLSLQRKRRDARRRKKSMKRKSKKNENK